MAARLRASDSRENVVGGSPRALRRSNPDLPFLEVVVARGPGDP